MGRQPEMEELVGEIAFVLKPQLYKSKLELVIYRILKIH
jgi:hypothetical protein